MIPHIMFKMLKVVCNDTLDSRGRCNPYKLSALLTNMFEVAVRVYQARWVENTYNDVNANSAEESGTLRMCAALKRYLLWLTFPNQFWWRSFVSFQTLTEIKQLLKHHVCVSCAKAITHSRFPSKGMRCSK